MIIHNDKLYYRLRFISWVVIPVLSIGWYIISGLIHTSTPSPVVGVVIAIDAYLGITLQISTARYQRRYRKIAGVMRIQDGEMKTTYSLELAMDPSTIRPEDELIFKVLPPET
jgi:hypothetical protein